MRKTFILSFLMTLFCSVSFGQKHWNVDVHQFEHHIEIIAAVVIDGVEQTNTNFEVGVFCDEHLHGSQMIIQSPNANHPYLAPLSLYIDDLGEKEFTFKVYDHGASKVCYTWTETLNIQENSEFGSIDVPHIFDIVLVAEVEGVKYGSLQAAVDAAPVDETVALLKDAAGAGVVINKNVTIDFNEKTYTVNQAVGSAGTETLGFQILKDNYVTFKNGTLTSTTPVVAGKEVKMLVQNYANLTLTDMNIVDNTNHILYALSNNSGNVGIDGTTSITTDAVAFDVCKYASYTEPIVNVHTTGTITGAIEVTTTEQTNLNISAGKFTQQLKKEWCAEGLVPVKDGEYWTVVEGSIEVTYNDGAVAYFSEMIDAVPYNNNSALNGATIKLLGDCEGKGMRFWQNGMTFDLNGFTYTINAATGSPNTESQGFQIRPEVTGTVTIKNGKINIASKEANVKWMFNNYGADFVVDGVTLECANMVTETNQDYLLVVQNEGDKATFTNVTINGYDAKKVYLTPSATFAAPEGFAVVTEEGYQVKYSNGTYSVEACNVLNTNTGVKYATMAEAVAAASSGNTIQLLTDIEENVTISKSLIIDGNNKNYTGKMNVKASITIKSVNFDGMNNYTYAVETRSAANVVIEDCTAKNYSYGFLQIASNNNTATIKNVTISDVNYGVKVDYSNNVVLENVNIDASVAAVLNSNYGQKTITIKNSELSILGTWVRNNTIKTYYEFIGANTIEEFVTDETIDVFKLAATDATLAAQEGLTVTTSVENSLVKYEGGKYIVKPAVAKIGDVYYETLTEAINAANSGATIDLLPVTISEYVAPWVGDSQHNSEKSITIVGSKDAEGKLTTTMTGGMYLGYDDSQCREHTIVVKDINFTGKGLKVACQQNVTIEGNTFTDITEGQAILVIGKNINSVVKYNVIKNVASAQGVELRNTLTATVEGNTISNTGHNSLQITSQVGATNSAITVTNNTMSDWGKGNEGRAMRVNDIVTANINGNVMSHTEAPEEFVKVTGSTTLDASANYWNGVSPLTEGMFTGVEGDLVPVLVSYYTDVEKTNLVTLQASVAKIGETYYASLASAIAGATAGNTIELLTDIEENVTISKKLTIDGGGHNSKGLISTNKNVTYTFKNFNVDGASSYFVKVTGGGGSYIFDNCNIKNSWGLIYTNKSTNVVSIKNSTVDNCEYGVGHFVSLNSATLENVKVINSTRGLMVQNQAAKTINFVSCDITATYPIYIWEKATSVITFNFEGENKLTGTIGETTTTYGKFVLTATDATLAAQEGLNVTTNVTDHVVEYNEGVYSVVVANVELVRNGESQGKFATLQQAIDAAQSGDKVVILKDLTVGKDNIVSFDGYNTFFKVENKGITIDLNGNNITGDVTGIEPEQGFGLVAMFSIKEGGQLTLEDEVGTAQVKIENADINDNNNVYSLISCYDSGKGSKLTINGGSYNLNRAKDCLIHSADDESVTINAGTFTLGNVGEEGVANNYHPWIFNANGKNERNVVVNGGTFNADVNHQFWANEVYVPKTLALQNNGNGTWTVVDAVAYVTEKVTSSNGSDRKVGYATFNEALASTGNNVAVLTPVVLTEDNDAFDLNGKNITNDGDVYPVIRIQGDANVTIKNGNITNDDYVFVLGASDGSSAGYLTIESGTYVGETTVASVTKGTLTIKGGEFSISETDTYDYAYLINCIDANYNDGSAKVSISGGKFHSWNPENNAAEGANTNFCATGYMAVKDGDIYEVVEIKEQTQKLYAGWNWFSSYIDIEGEEGLKKLQDGLEGNAILMKNQVDMSQYYNTDIFVGWDGTLETASVKEMYLIRMSEDHDLTLTGNIVEPSKTPITIHNNGWTWIGYPMNQEMSVDDALRSLENAKVGDHIKGLDGYAEYYGAEYGWWGSLGTMYPGKGYMYHSNSESDYTLTYSYLPEGAKSELRANITAENNHWVPASSQYANNMTITAMLSIDGEMAADNYEIAAFVGSEVRGSARAIYVEPLEAYMFFLTVHGKDVEEMTFKCYDLTTGEELELNNRVNYSSDAILGSIREPYMLSFGVLSVDEMSLNAISIYPNPTTTGREISLEATCDTVEVFNALGVKIAEYQNVDTIDAIETAGVYMIRVTNNGNVQNCRLVVK